MPSPWWRGPGTAGGRSFTAEHTTAFDQRLVHVAIADIAAHEWNLQVGEGLLDAMVLISVPTTGPREALSAFQARARMYSRSSPSTGLPWSSAISTRSPSPSKAIPSARSRGPGRKVVDMGGATPALMLMPLGSAPIPIPRHPVRGTAAARSGRWHHARNPAPGAGHADRMCAARWPCRIRCGGRSLRVHGMPCPAFDSVVNGTSSAASRATRWHRRASRPGPRRTMPLS